MTKNRINTLTMKDNSAAIKLEEAKKNQGIARREPGFQKTLV